MSLNSSQISDIEQWIRSHALNFECTCCGKKEWNINKELAFALIVESQGGRIDYLGGYPMVTINCVNCGYISLFSATQIGVMAQN